MIDLQDVYKRQLPLFSGLDVYKRQGEYTTLDLLGPGSVFGEDLIFSDVYKRQVSKSAHDAVAHRPLQHGTCLRRIYARMFRGHRGRIY